MINYFFPPTGLYTMDEYEYDNTTNGFALTGNTNDITFYDSTTYQYWNIGVTYTLGEVIRYLNKLWEVVVPSTIGTYPFASSDWINVTDNNVWIINPTPINDYVILTYENILDISDELLWIRVIGSPINMTLWEINYIACSYVWE